MNLIFQGKTQAALQLLSNEEKGSVLYLSDVVAHSTTVIDILRRVSTAHKFYPKWIKSGSVKSTYGRWIEADPSRFNERGGRCLAEVRISRHVA